MRFVETNIYTGAGLQMVGDTIWKKQSARTFRTVPFYLCLACRRVYGHVWNSFPLFMYPAPCPESWTGDLVKMSGCRWTP